MLAVCVDFEVDPASLDAFLTIMQKNASDSLANEVGCHQFDITQDLQNPTKIFFMSFMMMRLLLTCINSQATTLSSMMRLAGWLIKSRFVCCRELTANLEPNAQRFVFLTQKMFVFLTS